jgi:hypothetical protein
MALRYAVALPPKQVGGKRSSVFEVTLCVHFHFNKIGPFIIRLAIFAHLKAHVLPNILYLCTYLFICNNCVVLEKQLKMHPVSYTFEIGCTG